MEYAQPTAAGLLSSFKLDDLIKNFQSDQRTSEQKQAFERLCADAAFVYATPQGERLINALVAQTLQRVVFSDAASCEQVALHGRFREGQNHVVFRLLSYIALGRGDLSPLHSKPST